MPDDDVRAEHARRLLEQRFAEEAIAPLRATIAERARKAALPADLAQHVAEKLKANPHVPWDVALAHALSDAR